MMRLVGRDYWLKGIGDWKLEKKIKEDESW